MSGRIVHVNKEEHDFYIGRPTNWGNPFTHKTGTKASFVLPTREDSIEAFRKWLAGEEYQDVEPDRRQWILDNVHKLKDKTIGCWCAPKRCHGEVLRDLADGKDISTKEEKVERKIENTKLF